MIATTGSDALVRLRQQLRPYHDRIEAALNLMDHDVDRARYQQFLERSYGFVAACERALDVDHAPEGLAVVRRLKTQALLSDLKAMGHTDATIAALPIAARVPDVAQWPSALGYFYVMEGSTLGGQVLSRHFKATLDIGDDSMTFLTPYGAETGTMWKQMLTVLEEGLADEIDEPSIIETARDTFDLLTDWHAH